MALGTNKTSLGLQTCILWSCDIMLVEWLRKKGKKDRGFKSLINIYKKNHKTIILGIKNHIEEHT